MAEETWLLVHGGIPPHTDCSRLEGYAYAAPPSEGHQNGDTAKHSEGSRFENVRIAMEHYLALFEPDLEAGGYTVTFPDFGYGVTQGETAEEATEMAQDL